MGLGPIDYDLADRSPQQTLYLMGQSHATTCAKVVLLVRAFHARPDDWMRDDQLEAWSMLTEDEAWRWYLLGLDCGPDQRLIDYHQRWRMEPWTYG